MGSMRKFVELLPGFSPGVLASKVEPSDLWESGILSRTFNKKEAAMFQDPPQAHLATFTVQLQRIIAELTIDGRLEYLPECQVQPGEDLLTMELCVTGTKEYPAREPNQLLLIQDRSSLDEWLVWFAENGIPMTHKALFDADDKEALVHLQRIAAELIKNVEQLKPLIVADKEAREKTWRDRAG